MKKILLVSNMYPSSKYPHYGVFVRNTKEVLEDAGNIVDISVMGKEDTKFRKMLSYAFFYTFTFFKSLRKYDAIYAHYASHVAFPLLLAQRIRKTPIVLNVHGNDVVPEDKHDQKYIKLVRKLVKESELVICPSTYYRDVMNSQYSVDRNKIYVYPSGGVKTDFFINLPRNTVAKHLNLNNTKYYIGYVSRIEICKGWDIFLEACSKVMKEYSNINLIVVGGGDKEDEYEALVKDLGIQDKIIRYNLVSQSQLRLIYNMMDLFVFPTYRKSESLGLVGLEAMACGTLTILPNKYGPLSYGVDGENCVMFESGNSDSLYWAVKRAINLNDAERNRIKENARLTSKRYDMRLTKNILLDVFNRLI